MFTYARVMSPDIPTRAHSGPPWETHTWVVSLRLERERLARFSTWQDANIISFRFYIFLKRYLRQSSWKKCTNGLGNYYLLYNFIFFSSPSNEKKNFSPALFFNLFFLFSIKKKKSSSMQNRMEEKEEMHGLENYYLLYNFIFF